MKATLKRWYWSLIRALPVIRPVYQTRDTQTPIPLFSLLAYRFRRRSALYWPTHASSVVVDAHRIHIGVETSPGLMPGCYIQGSNGVIIGNYTQIAAGVAIISANHALTDNRAHIATRPIRIGAYSWLGAHSIVLPGVVLGEYTVVGAGAVVTKSFERGYQVLAGNPAKVIRVLDPAECVLHRSAEEFHGYIAAADFEHFRESHLEQIHE